MKLWFLIYLSFLAVFPGKAKLLPRRSSWAPRDPLAFVPESRSRSFPAATLCSRRASPLPRIRRPSNVRGTALNMCQLLGMNCANPTDFHFSFLGFSRRGGDTDKHSDGWGLAFFDGCGVRAFHDSDSAVDSHVAEMIRQYPVKTLNMISHIRYATIGDKQLCNVHPFQREMWGINWVFAHNGDMPKFSSEREFSWLCQSDGDKVYHPIGETDSEAIFCSMLNALRVKFKKLPSLPILHQYIQQLCSKIVENEENPIFNFLLMAGERTHFAYSWPGARPGSSVWNGLYYVIREPPFKQASLKDLDYAVDFADLNTEHDRVAVIATAPLTTDETWIEFKQGQLLLFDQGLPHASPSDCEKVEKEGHGLSTKCRNMLPISSCGA